MDFRHVAGWLLQADMHTLKSDWESVSRCKHTRILPSVGHRSRHLNTKSGRAGRGDGCVGDHRGWISRDSRT